MGGEELKLDKEKVLKYYKREDVQNAIYESAKDKEIGIKYEFGFGKRPDIINHPADVFELAKRGATSFHFSEELWKDPLQLSVNLSQREIDELRKGWDLIIDIDTPYFEYSKTATALIIEALKHHGISSITCKFSGNKGFHLGIPQESFPKMIMNKETKTLFPDGPKRVALYLKEMITPHLSTALLKADDIKTIAKNIGKEVKELLTEDKQFDPFQVVDIDTILISSRHLCRMPYSFNEKSGFISIPIPPDEVINFKREDAMPEKVNTSIKFLDRNSVIPGEASQLFIQAFDFNPNIQEDEIKKQIEFVEMTEAVPEQLFPPCIKKILEGVDDGKKRTLFILINFLSHVGWSYEMIDQRVHEWNLKNKETLKEVYIKGQLNYAKKGNRKLPPNCNNDMYYTGLKICFPDNLCRKVKNPVNYARRKAFAEIEGKEKVKEIKKKEIKKLSKKQPEKVESTDEKKE